MKEIILDAQLIAASPHSEHINTFVKKTMQKVKGQTLAAHLPEPKKRSIWYRLRHLPAPALAAIILALTASAVYAAVQFAPALVKLVGKETNQRGATEYSVAGFADCAKSYGPVAERFELKADAPKLSDDEVQKIIQAKCELKWVDSFPASIWQTTGPKGAWKDGDTIYYTRLDMLGTLDGSATDTAARVNINGSVVDNKPPQGEKIRAFAGGEEIRLNDLKPGDTVFTIARISETYRDISKYIDKTRTHSATAMPSNNLQTLGLAALFKMSLPLKYYTEMQRYVTEIPQCVGNDSELCPSTPGIDVYPRGSEGATNPYYQSSTDSVMHEISGTVTKLSGDTLTLKSRKGTMYTVTVGDDGFTAYNQKIGAYTDIDAALKVGSNVLLRYSQPKGADSKMISKEQVLGVTLQLEALNPKGGPIKPY
jgi:hypothetical protein